jgi:pyridoxamine 5'-phosphate oxidase
MTENPALADLRREYTLAGLRRAELDADPIAQFSKWLEQAIAAGLPEPTALTLATASQQGQPSTRIVLLKKLDEQGFTFFTNYESRKGRELAENPRVSLLAYWPQLERQVCLIGTAGKVDREQSAKYFKSRPSGSRLAAWASKQSEVISDRAALEKKLAAATAKYPGEEIPLPDYWGGYCVAPTEIEFWQGRPNRLHDRFMYRRHADASWLIERLSP